MTITNDPEIILENRTEMLFHQGPTRIIRVDNTYMKVDMPSLRVDWMPVDKAVALLVAVGASSNLIAEALMAKDADDVDDDDPEDDET